ncbi:FKBP-type peptidyl-prolyl cis-trans isomerase [Vibrio algicola]|uniref:Peptidyl-prolyl cis-trans isomerase n=1 Tax=Vibrio algicola TaxID=2662262 RepID=A0A5Q0TEI3_9VIBR|nr:FKBP-type peptidyl-prolyl cis-trans isomerase [Vibrio algicola]
MSNITNTSQVTLHFTIKLKDGSVADSTHNQGKPAKFVMGDGSLSENFEHCLIDLTTGDKKAIELAAKDAFGLPNPDFIQHMDRTRFNGQDLEIGTIMAFTGPDGREIPGIISQMSGDSVTVDFNHPLSGQDVIFDVEILNVE